MPRYIYGHLSLSYLGHDYMDPHEHHYKESAIRSIHYVEPRPQYYLKMGQLYRSVRRRCILQKSFVKYTKKNKHRSF